MRYCTCENPLMDVEHDAGCRRCGLPVDFSPTLCEHGVSFAPGEPDSEGRSKWCGECFPRPERHAGDWKGRARREAMALLNAFGEALTVPAQNELLAVAWLKGYEAGATDTMREAATAVDEWVAEVTAAAGRP
jgi:hypothetical protein